jgi:LDH2 family malate/lactate/ureidoglycolate dehydrogenase
VREDDPRLTVDALTGFSEAFLAALGCSAPVAAEVAAHLVEADLMGVYSHGTCGCRNISIGCARACSIPLESPG